MKFSVITTAHNEERFILQCIDSIQSQTHRDVEIIVVCDACTDRSPELVRSRGIEPIEIDACSTGMALNAGLEVASGDYFTTIGSDDYYSTPDAFRILHQFLLQDPVDVLAFGAYFGDRIASCHWRPGLPWPNVAFNMFNMETYRGCLFRDASYLEDRDWFSTYVRPSHRVGFLDFPAYQYRYPQSHSAIGKEHHAGALRYVSEDPDARAALKVLPRLPIYLNVEDDKAIHLLLAHASRASYLVRPTLVFVTDGSPTLADKQAVLGMLGRLEATQDLPFDVTVEARTEVMSAGDAWRFLEPLGGGETHLWRSAQILETYIETNRRYLDPLRRKVVGGTAEIGLPRSHAEATVQVLADLVAEVSRP